MFRALILGEDTAHAALVSGLVALQLKDTAHREHESWVWDTLTFSWTWIGEQDLSNDLYWEAEQDPVSEEAPNRIGIRYTKSIRAFVQG